MEKKVKSSSLEAKRFERIQKLVNTSFNDETKYRVKTIREGENLSIEGVKQ